MLSLPLEVFINMLSKNPSDEKPIDSRKLSIGRSCKMSDTEKIILI